MILLLAGLVLLASYLMGAIPFGLITVRLASGKDLRKVASGRTGGTNAMRAAGVPAGVATAILDGLKGFFAVGIARWLLPGINWLEVGAPLVAILGHNYSIFLMEKTATGSLRLRGGAGGATCLGGAFGLWPPGILIVLPLAFAVWYGIGYASIATMSIAFISLILFIIRAWMGISPWTYALFGLLSEIILVWALRPNLIRLLKGTERLVGWRARQRQLKTRINEQ